MSQPWRECVQQQPEGARQTINDVFGSDPLAEPKFTVPHPKLYDIKVDKTRLITQADVDLLTKAAEEAGLRNALVRRLLGWDRDRLREVRKLFDDNFNQPGRTNGQG